MGKCFRDFASDQRVSGDPQKKAESPRGWNAILFSTAVCSLSSEGSETHLFPSFLSFPGAEERSGVRHLWYKISVANTYTQTMEDAMPETLPQIRPSFNRSLRGLPPFFVQSGEQGKQVPTRRGSRRPDACVAAKQELLGPIRNGVETKHGNSVDSIATEPDSVRDPAPRAGAFGADDATGMESASFFLSGCCASRPGC